MKDVQEATGVMETTIRQIYKIMLLKAQDLLPSDFNLAVLPANLPTS